jgi:hypothetical protein
VDQRRSVERLPRHFLREFRRGQLAQLVVDQRQELLGRVRVAGFDAGQDVSDFVHGRHQRGSIDLGARLT